MTALLLLVLPVTGYLVGRWIEHACRPRQAVVAKALHEYIRNHRP